MDLCEECLFCWLCDILFELVSICDIVIIIVIEFLCEIGLVWCMIYNYGIGL